MLVWMAAVKAILPSTMLGSLPIGAYLYMNQQISLPILVACIIIPIGAIAPLMKLASAGEMLTTITANLKPVKDFLATPEQKRPDVKVEFDGRTRDLVLFRFPITIPKKCFMAYLSRQSQEL